MKLKYDIVGVLLGAVFVMLPCGCSMIDEDLSDCGEEVRIDYDLHLVTNMSLELQLQLNQRNDVHLIDALRNHLSLVFTDYARDIDLSFYDVLGDSARQYREQHYMNAHQMGLTLYLPRRDYMHTAVANVADNGAVVLDGDRYCHTARLSEYQGDTISPHKTGLFTARQLLAMSSDASRTYHVQLYMANCATALVIDRQDVSVTDLRMVATGFASTFSIADSAYVYSDLMPVVKADRISVAETGQLCFCTVNFPSATASTRTVIETNEPFVSADGDRRLWEMRVYATLPDGHVTETVLGFAQPLRPGQLKIIRGWVAADGSVRTSDSEVSTSVTLNWKEGLDIKS